MKNELPYYTVLETISVWAVLVPFFIGLFKRKYFDAGEKVLLYLMVVSVCTETLNSLLMKFNGNNKYVYDIYTILESILISLFYITILSSARLKILVYLMCSLFLVAAALELLNESVSKADLATTTESIIVIIYSIMGFYTLLQNPVQSRVLAIPLFWFNSGFLLYFAGNLFLFIFSNYIQRHYHKAFNDFWVIHSAMNILFYILISTGFWKTKER